MTALHRTRKVVPAVSNSKDVPQVRLQRTESALLQADTWTRGESLRSGEKRALRGKRSVLLRPRGAVRSFAFSPDHRFLACGNVLGEVVPESARACY